MDSVCPLCNGLLPINKKCPVCGQLLADGGSVNNYLGPYSPYGETAALPFHSEGRCIHLLYCPACGYDIRITLALVNM